MTDLRADDLRVGVVGMGIGQSHLLSWHAVDGASATVFAEIDDAKRVRARPPGGSPASPRSRNSSTPTILTVST